MNTISHNYVLHADTTKVSPVTKFMNWCTAQDGSRYGWLAVILTVHATVLAPITFFTILTTGIGFIYVPFVIASMTACLVSNLAAMPTRITIPIFFASVLVDLVILAIAVASLI